MKSTAIKIGLAVALVLTVAVALHAVAQPGQAGGPPGAPPGMMGPGGPGMGGPPGPPPGGITPVVVVSDGVVYVACDGKLTAFEAKTLVKLAEATYWERPAPPQPGQQKKQQGQ